MTMSAHCSAGAAVAAAAPAVSCLVSRFASASTRDVAHRRSATMSNATLFSRMRCENGHRSLTSLKTKEASVHNCNGVKSALSGELVWNRHQASVRKCWRLSQRSNGTHPLLDPRVFFCYDERPGPILDRCAVGAFVG